MGRGEFAVDVEIDAMDVAGVAAQEQNSGAAGVGGATIRLSLAPQAQDVFPSFDQVIPFVSAPHCTRHPFFGREVIGPSTVGGH